MCLGKHVPLFHLVIGRAQCIDNVKHADLMGRFVPDGRGNYVLLQKTDQPKSIVDITSLWELGGLSTFLPVHYHSYQLKQCILIHTYLQLLVSKFIIYR